MSGLRRIWPALLAAARGDELPGLPDSGLDPDERALAAIYLDFLRPRRQSVTVFAHLGQSLDGFICDGDRPLLLNDGPDFEHMHRLRALADAVLVGASTVAADDPELTVRHVEGPDPLRIVLDPRARLDGRYRLFRELPPATLVVSTRPAPPPGRAERLVVEATGEGHIDPHRLLRLLHARGIRRLFVEGGGITVSRFFEADALDRLQICVAPVLLGRGRRGLVPPPARPLPLRFEAGVLRLGRDVLIDIRLRATPA